MRLWWALGGALASCALQIDPPAPQALACGLTPLPGAIRAPDDACKVVRSRNGSRVSPTRDGCDDGQSCLELAPGQEAFGFKELGAPGQGLFYELDPSCSVRCE